MVRLEDYNGPLKKTVGIFARKLERKSVRPPLYKPGAILCSLELKDKFILFVMDSIDPVSFLDAGFNAGLAQAQDDDPTFGQGAAGYGKRFAASFADQASGKFFTDFAFPAIFSEDPRYYRLGSGSGGQGFLHAVEHVSSRTWDSMSSANSGRRFLTNSSCRSVIKVTRRTTARILPTPNNTDSGD